MNRIFLFLCLAIELCLSSCSKHYEEPKISWNTSIEDAQHIRGYTTLSVEPENAYINIKSLTENGDTIESSYSSFEKRLLYIRQIFPKQSLADIRKIIERDNDVKEYGNKYFYIESPVDVTIFGELNGNCQSFTFHKDSKLQYILFEEPAIPGMPEHRSFACQDIEKLGGYTVFSLIGANCAYAIPGDYFYEAHKHEINRLSADIAAHNGYR